MPAPPLVLVTVEQPPKPVIVQIVGGEDLGTQPPSTWTQSIQSMWMKALEPIRWRRVAT